MVTEDAARILIDAEIERRAVPRQAVNRCDVRMIWREGCSEFPRTTGRLIDISENGAGIVSGPIPGHLAFIWVGLSRLPWEWVKARIRAAQPRGELWCYHLEFAEPCPPGLFEAAAQPYIDELILMWNPE